MKSINSIQEAQQAINELYNRLDTLSVKNWDRRQTRIVNAHPSVDPYDYVVRKELDDLKGESVTEQVTGATEIHVFGVSGSVSIVSNGFPPLIFEHSVRLTKLLTVFNIAPTFDDLFAYAHQFQVDIFLRSTGRSILTPPGIIIPEGSTSVVEYTIFDKTNFVKDDILCCSITRVGNVIPGSMWTAYMLFDVLGE